MEATFGDILFRAQPGIDPLELVGVDAKVALTSVVPRSFWSSMNSMGSMDTATILNSSLMSTFEVIRQFVFVVLADQIGQCEYVDDLDDLGRLYAEKSELVPALGAVDDRCKRGDGGDEKDPHPFFPGKKLKMKKKMVSPKVIAITGSNGKTTTKDMVECLLAPHFRVKKTIGNYNNEIGLPLTILQLDRDTEISILEMGQ